MIRQLRPDSANIRGGRSRRSALIGMLVCVVLALSLLVSLWGPGKLEVTRAEIDHLRNQGQMGEAADLAVVYFSTRADSVDAAEYTAQCLLAAGREAEAASILESFPLQQLSVTSLDRLIEVNRHLLRNLSGAERAAEERLSRDPQHLPTLETLAEISLLTGRRHRAVPEILQLIQHQVDSELLVVLAFPGTRIRDREQLEAAHQAAPQDPVPLLGLAVDSAAEEDRSLAVQYLNMIFEVAPEHAYAWALLGEQLAAMGHWDALQEWAVDVPKSADAFPETWRARASLAEFEENSSAALRCFWEAVQLQPESISATYGLLRQLQKLGRENDAAALAERLATLKQLDAALRDVVYANEPSTFKQLLVVVEKLEAAGRRLEARAWARVGASIDPSHPELVRAVTRLNSLQDIPMRQTHPAAIPKLTLDIAEFPKPEWGESSNVVNRGESALREFSFVSRGQDVGFDFEFVNGTDWPPIKMFQVTGGGLGVVDYDLDGAPDLYCSQGGEFFKGPPPSASPAGNDALFRNLDGQRMQNVAEHAAILNLEFGQGVAVGDVNLDGFEDIVVGNIGQNVLWINHGDGTFEKRHLGENSAESSWTTSCALFDLDRDALPDLYEVNYLSGDDLFERVCRHADGSPMMCMPFDFSAAEDRVWLNDGAGRFQDVTERFQPSTAGKGLGIVAWHTREDRSLQILVANDTTENFLFKEHPDRTTGLYVNQGLASGVAYNRDGKAEGSMGIALGDLTANGQADLHITNFLAESNTLYAAIAAASFDDRTSRMGLHAPTIDALGFGTQFLDVDHDGQLELFVANGHIQDLQRYGKPFRMPAQLFQYAPHAQRLELAKVTGPHFEGRWLGRAVARLDWNLDLREDLAIGHLADRSVILENSTEPTGNCLAIDAIGIQSPRDGTGLVVEAEFTDGHRTHFQTAGDGYQASNQKQIVISTGPVSRIDRLVVHWPLGTVQQFRDVAVPQRVILVEGSSNLLPSAHRKTRPE